MKLTNQNNQITIKSGGFGQVLLGFALVVFGIGLVVVILLGVGEQNGSKAFGLGAGLLFAVIGVAISLFAKSQTVSIIKGGTTTVEIKRMIGSKTTNQSLSTNAIAAVLLQTRLSRSSSQDGDSTTSLVGVLSLQLSDGSVIDLGSKSAGTTSVNGMSLGGIRKAPLQQEANTLVEYLQVPLQTLTPGMNPGGIIGAVQNAVQSNQATTFAQSPATTAAATPSANPISSQPVGAPAQPTVIMPQQPIEQPQANSVAAAPQPQAAPLSQDAPKV